MKTKAGLSLFTLLLCLSVNSCNKYANHVDEAPWDKKGPITKSFVDPGDTLSNGLSGYKAIRISITSLEQLAAIELDTSIVILHYCTPGDNDKPQPIKLSSSSRGEDVLVCDAETAPDIDLYPIDVYWPDGKNIPDTINYMSLNDSLLSDRNGSVRRPGLDPLPLQPAFINGQVRAYDNRLSEYVSVKNAKIKYYQKQGSNEVLQYTTTDSNGNFILDVPAVYRDVELVLQNSNFIIRNGNTSAVKSISLGAPAFYYFEPLKGAGEDGPRANILPTSMQRDLSSDFFLDVYNAAHYYFNGNNELLNQVTRYSSTSPLNIFAVNHKDEIDDNRGTFSYNQSGTQLPYVTIYNPEIENYTGAARKYLEQLFMN